MTEASHELKTSEGAAPAATSALIVTHEPSDVLLPLTRAIEARGVHVAVVPPREWLLDDASVLLLRVLGGRLPNDAVYDLLPLETRGESVINGPASLRVAHHAVLSSNALYAEGVAHPRGFGCFSADDAVDHAFVLGFPVVVRPAQARGGAGVSACANADDLWGRADALARDQAFAGLLVQECVAAPADVHVLVAGDQVAGASLHVPSAGSGEAAWVPISVGDVLAELAVAAVRAIGGDVMSVHVLVGADGRVLVADVNGTPPIDRFPQEAWGQVGAFVAERCRAAA